MAPTKRQSNGRSPLVNPQQQITSFFSKTTSPSPSPSPTLSKLNPNKSNPNPSPTCDHRSTSPGPSPTTPSPLQSKAKKPRLVIGQTPSPPPSTPAVTKSYGEEIVGKLVRVYWPLDKAWYEGCVKSFDKEENKHLIRYEDDDEESLDLGKEKIEWVQQRVSGFKRLRRGSSLAFKKVVIEDDGAKEDEKSDSDCDSGDEDWEKKSDKEQMSEDDEVDLVDEKEEKVSKGKKRKAGGGDKKSKSAGDAIKGGFKVSIMEPLKIVESK